MEPVRFQLRCVTLEGGERERERREGEGEKERESERREERERGGERERERGREIAPQLIASTLIFITGVHYAQFGWPCHNCTQKRFQRFQDINLDIDRPDCASERMNSWAKVTDIEESDNKNNR